MESDNADGAESIALNGDLFDRYLERAESLMASADGHRSRVQTYGAVRVSVVVVAITTFIGLAVAQRGLLAAGVDLIAIVGSMSVIYSTISTRLVRPAVSSFRRDDDGMVEIITVLRDIEPYLADSEKWDQQRRVIAVHRLERFPLGAREV